MVEKGGGSWWKCVDQGSLSVNTAGWGFWSLSVIHIISKGFLET